MKTKSNKLMVVLIILLSLIVVGLSGFLVYTIVEMKGENKEVSAQNETVVKLLAEDLLDTYGYHTELSEKVKMFVSLEVDEAAYSGSCDILYSGSLQKDMSDSYVVPLENVSGNNTFLCSGETSVYSYDYVNNIYNELFGGEMPKEDLEYNEWVAYDYNANERKFVKLGRLGTGFDAFELSIIGIKNAKIEDEKLVIDVASVVLEADTDDPMSANFDNYVVSSDKNIKYDRQKVESKTDESVKNDLLKNHYDIMEKVQYVFELDDNHYILKDIVSK